MSPVSFKLSRKHTRIHRQGKEPGHDLITAAASCHRRSATTRTALTKLRARRLGRGGTVWKRDVGVFPLGLGCRCVAKGTDRLRSGGSRGLLMTVSVHVSSS
eukprot:3680608-Rhodomonas_salina.2